MKTIAKSDLIKLSASDSVASDATHVAIGDDNCVWGSGTSEHEAEQAALTELRPVVTEQLQRSVTDERVMRGVVVLRIVDDLKVRIFRGDATKQISHDGSKADPELWYYEPSDYEGDVLWSTGYGSRAEAYHAAGCSQE